MKRLTTTLILLLTLAAPCVAEVIPIAIHWDQPGDTSDLASFRFYFQKPGGVWEYVDRIGDVPAWKCWCPEDWPKDYIFHYQVPDAWPGRVNIAVSAVDESGNEALPTQAEWVLATPQAPEPPE